MRNNRAVLAAMAAIMILAIGLGAGCDSSKKAVGRVNGQDITSAEYEKSYLQDKAAYEYSNKTTVDENKDPQLAAQLHDQAFDELVNFKLIEQEAERRGIAPDQEYIDGRLNYIKSVAQQQGGEGNYAKVLQSLQMTEDDVKYQLKIEQFRHAIEDQATKEITVSDEEIQAYYNANQATYTTDGGIEIYHILVDSEEQARDIIAQIQAGADFGDMARQYSTCGSAELGGDLGVTNENSSLVPEFKTAALALQPGEMTLTPVKSEFGYHVIKAGKVVAAGLRPLEDVRDQVEQAVRSEKQKQAKDDYLKKLHDAAVIEDLRS